MRTRRLLCVRPVTPLTQSVSGSGDYSASKTTALQSKPEDCKQHLYPKRDMFLLLMGLADQASMLLRLDPKLWCVP